MRNVQREWWHVRNLENVNGEEMVKGQLMLQSEGPPQKT